MGQAGRGISRPPDIRSHATALRDKIEFVAGPAHAVLPAFPEWRGARLIAALAQGMNWLLVMRADLGIPGDINCVKGRTIGAAPDAQKALKADITLATKVGRAVFPPAKAKLVAATVERDLPYYDPAITELAVAGINRFATAVGLLAGPVPFEKVVALRFRDIWSMAARPRSK